MIDLIKEMWFKHQVRSYRKDISRLTAERRKLKTKQALYNQKVEEYTLKYANASKLEK
mgnify:CR=1 FL=1